MKDILLNIEEMLKEHLKGDILVNYENGVLRAQLNNEFLTYPITVSLTIPEEHFILYTPRKKIVDELYQKFRHFIEKNIFTWYD